MKDEPITIRTTEREFVETTNAAAKPLFYKVAGAFYLAGIVTGLVISSYL